MFSYSSSPMLFSQTEAMLPSKKHSAVAMCITPNQKVLMMQRAQNPNDFWSGHMAFPGGRYETGDDDLRQTAQRECLEELGFDPSQLGKCLGSLKRIHHPYICVDGFVYLLQEVPQITANEEVADYFWIELTDLYNPAHHTNTQQRVIQGMRSMPSIVLECLNVPIWGFSLHFIQDFFSRVTS